MYLFVSPQVAADTPVPVGIFAGACLYIHTYTYWCLRRCLLTHLYLLLSPQVAADTVVPIGVSAGACLHTYTYWCLHRWPLTHMHLLVSPVDWSRAGCEVDSVGADTPVLLVSPQGAAHTAVPICVSAGACLHTYIYWCLHRWPLTHMHLLVSPGH